MVFISSLTGTFVASENKARGLSREGTRKLHPPLKGQERPPGDEVASKEAGHKALLPGYHSLGPRRIYISVTT